MIQKSEISKNIKRLNIMNPNQFEKFVADRYEKDGYKVEQTPCTGDYGVDVFAYKGKQKVAVQVKMYGDSTRKVNRQMIMELYGAMAYYDCTSAELALTGNILGDAQEVANKLGIKIVHIDSIVDKPTESVLKPEIHKLQNSVYPSFYEMWGKYIVPLKGKELSDEKGTRKNKITDVDLGGIERITSTGKSGKIDIEIFKLTYNHLLENNSISRDEINQQYVKRASSGVVLIMSQVPFIELKKVNNKLTLSLKI